MMPTSKTDLMAQLAVGDHVKTIFNPQRAFKVLKHERVGAGHQITIETIVAGQRSEQLIRGNEVTALIKPNGEIFTCKPRGPLYRALQDIHEKSGADPSVVIIEDASKVAPKEHVVTAPRTPPTHRPIPERKPTVPASTEETAESIAATKPKAASGPDFVADLLARRPFREVAKELGLNVQELDEKYAHLDAPKQRMCFGNLIRARYRKDPAGFEAQFTA